MIYLHMQLDHTLHHLSCGLTCAQVYHFHIFPFELNIFFLFNLDIVSDFVDTIFQFLPSLVYMSPCIVVNSQPHVTLWSQ